MVFASFTFDETFLFDTTLLPVLLKFFICERTWCDETGPGGSINLALE